MGARMTPMEDHAFWRKQELRLVADGVDRWPQVGAKVSPEMKAWMDAHGESLTLVLRYCIDRAMRLDAPALEAALCDQADLIEAQGEELEELRQRCAELIGSPCGACSGTGTRPLDSQGPGAVES